MAAEEVSLIAFTGERFVPAQSGVETEIDLEHVQRYLACLHLARDKIVLDAACGEGYGSAMLASVARSVVGVDINPETVAAARLRYSATGAQFYEGSVLALPFGADSFDLIVSFETLEHIGEHDAMLAEFRRMLKPGGTLVVSTPNKEIYNRSLSEPNDFHLKELERSEFKDLLDRHFTHTRLYGQRVVFGALLTAPDAEDLTVVRRIDTERLNTYDAFDVSMYLIALCSDEEPPHLAPSIYEGSIPQNALSSLLGGVADRDRQIRDLWERAASAPGEAAAEAARALREEVAVAKAERDRALSDADERVRQAAWGRRAADQALEESELRRRGAEARIESLESLVEANGHQLHMLDSALAAEQARATALEADLAEQARNTERLRARVSEVEAEAVSLQQVVASQANELEATRTQLAETEEELIHSEAARRADHDNFHAEQQRQERRIGRMQTAIQRQQEALDQEIAEVGRLTDEVDGLSAEIVAKTASAERLAISHRITLGEFSAQAQRATELTRLYAEAVDRPAPPSGGQWLKDALFSTLRARQIGARRGIRDFRALRALRASRLFDPTYVLRGAPEGPGPSDVARRYLALKAEDRPDPSPLFSGRAYLRNYPDVAEHGFEPLSHYEMYGRAEGRVAPFSKVFALPASRLTQAGDQPAVEHPYEPARPAEVYKPDWILRRAPHTNPTLLGLYDRRPDDVVPLEGAAGEDFLHAYRLLGNAPDFAGAVAMLNAMDAVWKADRDEAIDVSIVVPVYGQLAYTLNCLHSLARHASRYSFEIILIDDVSPDQSGEILPLVSGLRYHRQPENGGFVVSCNAGAAMARGRYVVMLNNDTRVCEGWLDWMIDSFTAFPKAGLVGSKLFYPDGSLQEAGGIFWQDGSAWNYGRNDDPNRPEYCYARQVDYVSGASIALPLALWNELGGFDEFYKPAYCEDADLAFRVRAAGRETWFQPLSRVIHYEGKTSGTDVTKGVKAYQITNGIKFLERWRATLISHRPNGQSPQLERERDKLKRVLVIDAVTPTPDQDAGSVTTVTTLKIYQALGYKVYFLPQDNLLFTPGYTQAMQAMGVECIYAPFELNFADFMAKHGGLFDFIQVFRVNIANRVIDDIRRYAPRARVAFHNMDMHFLRLERQAALSGDKALAANAAKVKVEELTLINKVDCTIVHSPVERDMLAELAPDAEVVVFPYMVDREGAVNGFDARQDIIFLGGYRHTPNVDAAVFFIREVWPLLANRLPNARFLAVGAHPPLELRDLASDRVLVTGMVPELTEWFERSRVFAASIRYGAGIKGKVATSMAHGVPVVATEVAAEGMYLTDGKNVLIADDPAAFAEAVYRLYTDHARWEKMSKASLDFVSEYNSFEMGVRTVREVIAKAEAHAVERFAQVAV